MMIFKKKILLILPIVFMVTSQAGCGGSSNTNDIDNELRALVDEHGLKGDPSLNRDLPDINEPLPQLGKLLFFSKALSGDQDTACVTCHHPMLGGGDDLSIAIGVAALDQDVLGPGRLHDQSAFGWDGGPTMPRNVPSVFNVGMLDKAMFWDGRVSSLGKTAGMNGADGLGIRTPDSAFDNVDLNAGENLVESVAAFPILVHEEMRGFEFEASQDNQSVRDHLAARLGNYGEGIDELSTNNWLSIFQAAFAKNASAQELITYSNIAKALGEYMRSQVFVESPWKKYVNEDYSAISESAKRGAMLFFKSTDQNGANCISCHNGDFFTDEKFHVLAVPQIGRGNGNGDFGDDDFGRFNESQNPEDMYAFRTPTLMNVTATGPWGHSGAFESLEDIVRHHLNVNESVESFDYSQIKQQGMQTVNAAYNTHNALHQLIKNRQDNKTGAIRNVNLSDQQVADILEFLNTLTDPCVENRQCLSPWIPNEDDPDPDSLRLIGVDRYGNLL